MRTRRVATHSLGLNVAALLSCLLVVVFSWFYINQTFSNSSLYYDFSDILGDHSLVLFIAVSIVVVCSIFLGDLGLLMQRETAQRDVPTTALYLCGVMVSLATFSYLLQTGIFFFEGIVQCFFLYVLFSIQVRLFKKIDSLHRMFLFLHHTFIAGIGFLLFPQMLFFLLVTWFYVVVYAKKRTLLYNIIRTAFFLIPLYLYEVYNYAMRNESHLLRVQKKFYALSLEHSFDVFYDSLIFKLMVGIATAIILFSIWHIFQQSKRMRYDPILFLLVYLLFIIFTSRVEEQLIFYTTILGVSLFFSWAARTKYYRLLLIVSVSLSVYLLA